MVKECSLYQFKFKDGTIENTTPKDLTARKQAARLSGIVNHGATVTVTVDLTSVPVRVLYLAHGSRSQIRGCYLLRSDGGTPAVIAATEAAITLSGNTLTIKNNTTTSDNLRYAVI